MTLVSASWPRVYCCRPLQDALRGSRRASPRGLLTLRTALPRIDTKTFAAPRRLRPRARWRPAPAGRRLGRLHHVGAARVEGRDQPVHHRGHGARSRAWRCDSPTIARGERRLPAKPSARRSLRGRVLRDDRHRAVDAGRDQSTRRWPEMLARKRPRRPADRDRSAALGRIPGSPSSAWWATFARWASTRPPRQDVTCRTGRSTRSRGSRPRDLVVVRTGEPDGRSSATSNRIVHAVDPAQPVSNIRTLDEESSTRTSRRGAWGRRCLTAFAGFALVLAVGRDLRRDQLTSSRSTCRRWASASRSARSGAASCGSKLSQEGLTLALMGVLLGVGRLAWRVTHSM